MVKHNKAVDCNQFRKDIHPLIKTWLNQPARKERRRRARHAKIAALGGMTPINTLKPFVNCPSQKYNDKLRAGRGFTLEELKAVGLTVLGARSIRISVDMRRTNTNAETFNRNVERLKSYLSNIAVVSASKKAVQNKGGVPRDTLASELPSKNFSLKINNKPIQKRGVLVA